MKAVAVSKLTSWLLWQVAKIKL